MTVYADRGKWAEAQAAKWLEVRSGERAGFAWHRYPDSRAARGVIANQPADFLVAEKLMTPDHQLQRRAWHLEVKETKETKRLPKAKIGQYGKLKLFGWAGITPVVLVFRSVFSDWVILTENDLMSYDECPASFPLTNLPYASAGFALTEIFK